MASTLRDDLSLLKIERPQPVKSRKHDYQEYSSRDGGGLRLLFLRGSSWLFLSVWPSGASMVGYRQYDQLRSRPEVIVGAWSSR